MSPCTNKDCLEEDSKQQILNRLMVFSEHLKRGDGVMTNEEFTKLIVSEATDGNITDEMFRTSVKGYLSNLEPGLIKEFCHPECQQLELIVS